MSKNLKITYLFESTDLWGGTKVGLEQAEALSDAGYNITILSKDAGPTWYDLRLPVIKVSGFDVDTIPESDIIVGTYWPTVRAAYESHRGIAVHLCQGYEGGCKEYNSFKAAIDEVYSYRIPKLTISLNLDKFLIDRFNAETYYIGQMLNRDIFYPSTNSVCKKLFKPFKIPGFDTFKVLVVGPFEADVKNIAVSLKGISLAKKSLGHPLKLIRVSQFPLSAGEKEIMKPDTYHFHVPHQDMGKIYRKADVLISMSNEAEGFGLPPLEAMASGIPTILSKISSHLVYDDPQDYAVFSEFDPEALSEVILSVFRNSELRDRISKRGLLVADKYTRESVVSRLDRAFNDIVSRSQLKGGYDKVGRR
ncbi:MAG: glycosyltransferase family 4 protein [Thermodesulfovibrionales bacterium]|jgi:glycosyltransferase involved in cell wall biosynthesis